MLNRMWRKYCIFCLVTANLIIGISAHDAKDFDDSIQYKIDFEIPDFEKNPDLKNHLKTFYTHEHEKYDCVIPIVEEPKEETKTDQVEICPLGVLYPLFISSSCSFRIEPYWSYEICHGRHVRQYHEEREGKATKFQEYYLGRWDNEKTEQLEKQWEEDRKAGIKYKTVKIENTKYPYFEMEMSDGTICDITKAPRTTVVRYICYPNGKNTIYSFKETFSCNYEAIVLTSVLCMIPGFTPEESKEVSIKCYNSPTEPHKPLSMLRQELNDQQLSDADIPVLREAKKLAEMLTWRKVLPDNYVFLEKSNSYVDKLVIELMSDNGDETPAVSAENDGSADNAVSAENTQLTENESSIAKAINTPLINLTPIKEFVSGKNCLTGGTGWWRYEFCYGRYVRQFHKDKNVYLEIYLGYFSAEAHQEWLAKNPEKTVKREGPNMSLWHHYEQGTKCDGSSQAREVDVKLTCVAASSSATAVSMYLLEPKTCQYILVLESPIVCDIIQLADEHGLVDEKKLQKLLVQEALIAAAEMKAERDAVSKKIRDQLDEASAKKEAKLQRSRDDDLLNEAET